MRSAPARRGFATALAKGAERGRWSAAEAEAAAARLRAAPRLEDLAGCELVIEAAPEDLELKRELFARLAEVCGAEAILATNTSSLSVTAIAAGVERPERVCGMHFFNPPALMRLVEVVAGDETSEETLAIASEVARAMGREPIRAADAIGFVANRVARPFTLEALRLLGERIATHDQIDRIVRIGGGFRMGPFELMDLVGVDVNFEVAKSFWEQSFHEPRWQPHPIQARMVAAGRLGRKAGRGYYDYGEGPHRPDDPEPRRIAIQAGAETPRSRSSVHFSALPEPRMTATPGRAGARRRRRTAARRSTAAETYFRGHGQARRVGRRRARARPRPDRLPDRQRGPLRRRRGRRHRRGRGHRHAARLQLAARAVRVGGGDRPGPRGQRPGRAAVGAGRGALSGGAAASPRRQRNSAAVPSTASHEPARISARPASVATVICSPSSDGAVDDREPGRQVGDDERARRAHPADQRVEDHEREPGADHAQRGDRGQRARGPERTPGAVASAAGKQP